MISTIIPNNPSSSRIQQILMNFPIKNTAVLVTDQKMKKKYRKP
jgi:F420-0:gamma-glutamyl ligase